MKSLPPKKKRSVRSGVRLAGPQELPTLRDINRLKVPKQSILLGTRRNRVNIFEISLRR